jgi:prepilin-type N-terminal cleavage/methylation domain-containing protein
LRRGFSLTETIVALSLFGIVGTAAFGFLISQHRYYESGERVQMAQQEARGTVRLVTDEIRRAGAGINAMSASDPDIIVPNDGSVGIDVFDPKAVKLISVNSSIPSLPLTTGGNNGQKNRVFLWVPDTSNLGGLAVGQTVFIEDSNSGNTQLLRITKITDLGDGRIRIEHLNDPLTSDYAPSSSAVWLVNEVAFRLANVGGDLRVERRLQAGAWETIAENATGLNLRYFDDAGTEITPNSKTLRRAIRRIEVAATITMQGSGARGAGPVDFVYRSSVSPRNQSRGTG